MTNEELRDATVTRKAEKRRNRKLRNLMFVCAICAIVLAASTYAWFTGLQEVKVNPFQVEIAAADSLQLSLNGQDWSDTIAFTDEADLKSKAYSAGTRVNWPKYKRPGTDIEVNGLVPVSTIGIFNTTKSELKLFEKQSMTTSAGGYRLLANEINYDEETRQKGYLAFDLFVKNFSGTQYISSSDPNNIDSEEAIYLTPESAVTVGEGGVQDAGIENSVRVAFAQVGRISANETTQSNITDMTCAGGTEGATGICRDAQIWEPNDTAHVTTALNWYNTSCRKRDNSSGNFLDTNCETVTGAVPTYSIAKAINPNPNAEQKDIVDIYDGPEYNGYTNNTIKETTGVARNDSKPLLAVDTFTDSEKNLKGVDRPSFMTLAPNSITKVRVYVYIEGQDIDNFDYASVGKYIKVGFGFTKQRFTSDDVDVTEGELYDNLPTAVHPTASH
ncbi:MAG: hypothetical protein PUA68_03515 [Bacilli bacterium]|nr:hypothetical protein [Bacilli bacterium]